MSDELSSLLMAQRQFMPVKDAPEDVWVLAWREDWFLPMPSMLTRSVAWVGYGFGTYDDDDQPTHFCFWPELPKKDWPAGVRDE